MPGGRRFFAGLRCGAGWACGLAALAGGCLVTDRVVFGEPNVPAHLEPRGPVNFTRVPDEPDPACNSLSQRSSDFSRWMAFVVEVSDPNIEDKLEARLVVNGEGEAAGAPITVTGNAERGLITLCAKRSEFTEPCNRVEFLVSSRFSVGGHPYGTEDVGDLARWEWWVLNPSGDDPTVTPSDCDKHQADAGLL